MAEQVSTTEDINDLYDSLTGTQKCAILMMLLGEDEAAEIMKNLSPKEVQTLGSAMYSVQGLPQETVNLVLDEFLAIIKGQTSLGIEGTSYIKNVLTKALGEDKAESVLGLSLIHISEPTRLRRISYAVFCLKKKKNKKEEI